ncbi:MAG: hypothetical protein QM811_19225 [Pirellulales bacterium]
MVLLFVSGAINAAEGDAKIAFREGGDFRTALTLKSGGAWSGVPLTKALDDISRAQRVCILRDRRIDPETSLVYELRDVSLEALLRGLAEHLKLGLAFGDSWVYLGPPATATKLATLVELRKDGTAALAPAVRGVWNTKRLTTFGNTAEPRKLIERIAVDAKTTLVDADRIPHDLWPSVALPKTSRIEELSLILAQYDLTWNQSADGATCKIIPIPETVVLRRDYPIGNADPTAQLKKLGLQGTFETRGKTLTLSGPAEEHRMVADLLAGKRVKTTAVTAGEQRFTLSIKSSDGGGLPVGKSIEEVGGKLGFIVRFDQKAIDAAGRSLDTPVKMSVTEVSREELIQAILKPAGLIGRIRDKELLVEPLTD